MHTPAHIESIISQYVEPQTLAGITSLHGGLINATYKIQLEPKGKPHALVLQRVNTSVFNKPKLVMRNIETVTHHLKTHFPNSRNLQLLPSIDGAHYVMDGDGGLWRAFNYLEDCITYETVSNVHQAAEAGKAFGGFLEQMHQIDAGALVTVIPQFHDTRSRYQALEQALLDNKANRAGAIPNQINYIRNCLPWLGQIESLRVQNALPNRITHNDTKISNVLFDSNTKKAVCVIDLDTVMPGSMLYDYGDLVRTTVNNTPEDESEHLVECNLEFFEALSKGYLSRTRELLTPTEKTYLLPAVKIMTLELAIRFLTDYLEGDTYFKVTRKTQNLERARNQIQLLREIEKKEPQMQGILEGLLS